jgi:formiminotetrahydrofolate cyclodeaminase
MELDAYLDALASAAPAPGGGSAATLVGAMGAALCAMVARITAESPKHAAVAGAAAALAVDADVVRARLLALRPRDEAAFGAVVAAQRLPRASEAERATRTAAVQAALAGAAGVPLETAEASAEIFALADRAEALGNAHLASDVVCARYFARAAYDAAVANVRVNHGYLHDAALVAIHERRIAELDALARAS